MRKASILLAAFAGLFVSSCSTSPKPESKVELAAAAAVPLFDNLGTHHHAITTTNESAQKYFDQGLRLVYGFNHDEAERAFLEAARLDPKSAMAWWGVALALGPNINLPLDDVRNKRALEAVQKAQSLKDEATEAEQAYIDAVAIRYSADPGADRAKLDRAYGDAMRALSRRFPDDLDAAVLYAESLMDLKPWQLWTPDGKPQEGTEEILKVLEGVLAKASDHPGANHYYIHATEASRNPEKALPSAQRLKTLVPGAGHLVHMPAHVYVRTGDYQGAIDANADAVRVDAEYIARTNAHGVYPMMYYTHNFMFLSYAAGMTGRTKQALESAQKAVEIAGPMAGHEPMAEYVLPSTLFALLRAQRWDDVLAQPRPADSTPAVLAFWHYARGMAFVAKGDSAARKEKTDFEAATKKIPAEFTLNLNSAHNVLKVAASVLDARLASMAGDRGGAIAHWNKAVTAQDLLNYDEPPAWYYPVRESLGGEYLRARRFAEAEKVFRRDLEINPKNARSLFGLQEALKGQSRDAADVSRRFEEAWKGAEISLSLDTL